MLPPQQKKPRKSRKSEKPGVCRHSKNQTYLSDDSDDSFLFMGRCHRCLISDGFTVCYMDGNFNEKNLELIGNKAIFAI